MLGRYTGSARRAHSAIDSLIDRSVGVLSLITLSRVAERGSLAGRPPRQREPAGRSNRDARGNLTAPARFSMCNQPTVGFAYAAFNGVFNDDRFERERRPSCQSRRATFAAKATRERAWRISSRAKPSRLQPVLASPSR